ncbi:hypothetical protein [Fusibacter sp. 3D3]|uniref:hypothetical protein n=1 Tax=Fusibacter sp. 3D3 TaxID=1048380 RepID=UPI000853AF49|nr:hypothetical protein [Fusibacter sp. 3D3]GAU78443.1 hypothetical protein F3D3_3077 [Fusibacter sp. 3D3]
MQSRKKYILQFALILVLFLIVLRLVGVIDLSLYTSKFNSNQTASFGKSSNLKNYQIELEYKDKNIDQHMIINGDYETETVTVKIETYTFSGNYYLPFYKNFVMHYKCTYKTPPMTLEDGTEGHLISGEIEGAIESEITGLCTIKKAKALAIERAVEAMKNTVIQSIIP